MSLAGLLAIILAVASPPPEVTGTLVGDDGKPVPGATITIQLVNSNGEASVSKTVSLADGSFSFTGLASGAYGLVAKTKSSCAISSATSVHPGFTSVVHLQLVKGLCSSASVI
jgi:hypothetical protein